MGLRTWSSTFRCSAFYGLSVLHKFQEVERSCYTLLVLLVVICLPTWRNKFQQKIMPLKIAHVPQNSFRKFIYASLECLTIQLVTWFTLLVISFVCWCTSSENLEAELLIFLQQTPVLFQRDKHLKLWQLKLIAWLKIGEKVIWWLSNTRTINALNTESELWMVCFGSCIPIQHHLVELMRRY